MEIAMLRQALQSKDIAFMRNSVIDNLQKSQTSYNVGDTKPAALASSKRMTFLTVLGLSLLEAKYIDLAKMVQTVRSHSNGLDSLATQ
jgi:hypothetical protein